MPRDTGLPSITAELFAIQHGAEERSAHERRRAREQVAIYRAYQRLFFDDAGQLRADARIVLDDLTREAALGFVSPSLDLAELAVKEGKRRLLLHLFARFELSEERLANLERSLIQEENHE